MHSSPAAYNASRGAQILSQLYELVACEVDEPTQLAALNAAISKVEEWLGMERMEIGTPNDMSPDYYGKALGEMKAEPLDASHLDSWLAGKTPRRMLLLPFGGPLPGGKSGLDLDAEYFDMDTDYYGPFPSLRASRDRLVDWHHGQDPTGTMKGAILGKAVFDEKPEADGLWADFWANAGEQRRSLVAALERRGVPLYGSSEAIPWAVKKASDGHIDVWPIIRHTITTSPQNTRAVVPPLKAILTAGLTHGSLTQDAVSAALLGISDLRTTSPQVGKAGASELESAIMGEAKALLGRLRDRSATRT